MVKNIKFVMTLQVYNYINDPTHKKPIYQSTRRALKGYVDSGVIELVENDFQGSDSCIFVVETDDHCRILASKNKNNFARFNFRDKYSTLSNPRVVECKSFCRRSLVGKHEIPLPLIPDEKNFNFNPPQPETQSSANSNKYFITFKGKMMQFDKSGGLRLDLLPLHNNVDIIICPLRHFGEVYDTYCEAAFVRSDFFQYDDLMNTDFGFVPGGRQPATYRLIECLRLGVIPVIYEYTDLTVLPFEDRLDWSAFSIYIPAIDIGDKIDYLNKNLLKLRSLSSSRREAMKDIGRKVFDDCFSNHARVGDFLRENYRHIFVNS